MDGGVEVRESWWVVALRAGGPLLRAVMGAAVTPAGPHAGVLREALGVGAASARGAVCVRVAHRPEAPGRTAFAVCPVSTDGPAARRRTARAWAPWTMVAWIGVPGPRGAAALAVFSAPGARSGGSPAC
jgi:hypothetical protein